ncbi:hypothetical protein SRHO_G00074480 [Serrasalmus rhombeus]
MQRTDGLMSRRREVRVQTVKRRLTELSVIGKSVVNRPIKYGFAAKRGGASCLKTTLTASVKAVPDVHDPEPQTLQEATIAALHCHFLPYLLHIWPTLVRFDLISIVGVSLDQECLDPNAEFIYQSFK